MKFRSLFLVLIVGIVAGCFNETPKVTANEEKAFRNPPKEMPAAASEGMRKGMEEAAKHQGGN